LETSRSKQEILFVIFFGSEKIEMMRQGASLISSVKEQVSAETFEQ